MMTDEAEKYATFWTEFGRAVKEGLLDDPDNREQILQICSFASTHDDERADHAAPATSSGCRRARSTSTT